MYRYLRPPGALPEREFLKRCTHCGQCAAVCPYRSIVMAGTANPLIAGTPVIAARATPCWLCMKCPPACPTGALVPVPMDKAGMGRAVLDRQTCYTYEGTVLCRSCFERCPLKAKAIVMERAIYPVITEDCVGCGVCDHVCPRRSIVIDPRREISTWWAIRSLFSTEEP